MILLVMSAESLSAFDRREFPSTLSAASGGDELILMAERKNTFSGRKCFDGTERHARSSLGPTEDLALRLSKSKDSGASVGKPRAAALSAIGL
jgi:hypothetical protein